MNQDKGIFWAFVALFLAVPATHPALIPLVGVPSHLLWWIHVLPVAMVTYREGKRGGAALLATSAILVLWGERIFGAGYGRAADWPTALSLAVALSFTNVLVAGFALYARRSVQRYQVLFDAAESGIIRVDSDLRIEAANPAALKLLSVEWADLRGLCLNEVRGLEQLPSPIDLERKGWEGTVIVGPESWEMERHLFAAAVSQEDAGGYQVLLLDRTAEVAQERELERKGRLATLGEALAGVAHELNNPLSVITAWSDLAKSPETDEDDMREGFRVIGEQADRMKELGSELLGYSRPQGEGKAQIDEVVERVVRMERIMQREARIETHIGWKGEVPVSGGKVEQILVNLVSNAADAAADGEGRIDVVVEAENNEVVVRVSDNGPGVPPNMRERIFEPFLSTKPEGEGTGLGLPISRRLARSMGGDLSVGDAPGGGAAFTLRLPSAMPVGHKMTPAPSR